jgi:hypothetical protein
MLNVCSFQAHVLQEWEEGEEGIWAPTVTGIVDWDRRSWPPLPSPSLLEDVFSSSSSSSSAASSSQSSSSSPTSSSSSPTGQLFSSSIYLPQTFLSLKFCIFILNFNVVF